MTTMIWSLNWRIPSFAAQLATMARSLLEGSSLKPQVSRFGAGLDQGEGEEVGPPVCYATRVGRFLQWPCRESIGHYGGLVRASSGAGCHWY